VEPGRSPDPRFAGRAKKDVAMQSEEGKPREPLINRRKRTMKMIASIERLHLYLCSPCLMALRAARCTASLTSIWPTRHRRCSRSQCVGHRSPNTNCG